MSVNTNNVGCLIKTALKSFIIVYRLVCGSVGVVSFDLASFVAMLFIAYLEIEIIIENIISNEIVMFFRFSLSLYGCYSL